MGGFVVNWETIAVLFGMFAACCGGLWMLARTIFRTVAIQDEMMKTLASITLRLDRHDEDLIKVRLRCAAALGSKFHELDIE